MVIIYAATIFLSAFLLFQVQPVMGKMVLPWFGGSAAVWTTCMLLFQVLLLAGYLYAHLATRYLSPRRQAWLHVALLAAALFTLPLSASGWWQPQPASDPALLLLGMLAASVGLPYFLLSSTGPLLQHWFAGERPGSVPYRLFALSNFGSMLGLLSFPLLFEPTFGMTQIGNGWSVGFVAFALLSAALALRAAGVVRTPDRRRPADWGRPAGVGRTAGVAGAAMQALMHPARVPLLAPAGGPAARAAPDVHAGAAAAPHTANADALAADALATDAPATDALAADTLAPGVQAPDSPAPAVRNAVPPAAQPTSRMLWQWCALAALPTVFLMAATSHLTANIAPMPLLWVLPLALYLLTFILAFDSPRWYQRPLFLIALLALTPLVIGYINHPSLLPRGIAWPVALYCSGVFVFCMSCHGELARLKPSPQHLTSFYLMIAAGGALGGACAALLAPRFFNDDHELPLASIAILALLAFTVGGKWSRTLLTASSLVGLAWLGMLAQTDHEFKARNFYGTVKVKEADGLRQLSHGAIMHGQQFLDPARARTPTAYFGAESGVGLAIRTVGDAAAASATLAASAASTPLTPALADAASPRPAQRIGIVGLGAGTLAAYCQRGDTYRFYEINPLVSQLAASHFSYLKDCPGKSEVILGDARLSMASEAAQHYDLLILDAFSGDAIPVHLLTQEAFATWFRHLKPGGVLAVHISNLYLDLAPVVANAAASFGHAAFIVTSRGNTAQGANAAQWVLVGPPGLFAGQTAARRLAPAPGRRLWTDQYSSIAGILR